MRRVAMRARPSRVMVAIALVATVTFARRARAEFPASCPGLGDSLVSHSCFHARYGPFRTVTSAPPSEVASAPRIDGAHTHYEVVLSSPASPTVVTYQVASAARAGAWAFFHSDSVPLAVETLSGARLTPVHTQRVPTCAALPNVSVYTLGAERVKIVLGPANVTRAVIVPEYVEDFVVENGRDSDGDGYGTPIDTVASFCVPPTGYVQNAGDCDDTNPAVNPGATEVCDGVDQNCNSVPDDIGLPCTAGTGTCGRDGVVQCSTQGTPARCSVSPGPSIAEACDGKDTNCDGVDDLDTPALCADASAPRCIVDRGAVRCGCTADIDCGNVASGRICDLETKRCIEGCVDLRGRNACPPGRRCSSADPAAPGRCEKPCVPECASGALCQEGTCVAATSPDAGSQGDGGPPLAEPSAESAAGCACDLAAPTVPSLGASSLVATALVLGLVRRRRR